jgi:hypothetical protein
MLLIKTEQIEFSENELNAMNIILRMAEDIKRETEEVKLSDLAADIICELNELYEWGV